MRKRIFALGLSMAMGLSLPVMAESVTETSTEVAQETSGSEVSTQESFLKDLSEGLKARWAYDKDEETMTNEEFIEYRTELVNAELNLLSKYKDASFENAKFALKASAYIEALELQLSSLKFRNEEPDIYDQEWGAGYAVRAILIPEFVDHYGLVADEEGVADFREYTSGSYTVTTTTEETEVVDSTADATETATTTDEPIEVYSQDGITVKLQPKFTIDDYSASILFTVENLTHHNIYASTDGSTSVINGVGVLASPYGEIKSGKTGTAEMYISNDSLVKAGINSKEDISDIEVDMIFYDDETYNTIAKTDTIFLKVADGKVAPRMVYTDAQHIKEVQEMLGKLGYEVGNADGVPGKNTNNCILQFEKDHGLAENTDITPELIAALESAVQ